MPLVICTCKDKLTASGLPGDKTAHYAVTLFLALKKIFLPKSRTIYICFNRWTRNFICNLMHIIIAYGIPDFRTKCPPV